MKITHPVTRAALGVAALVTIALFANWLVLLTPQASRGIDFTEKNIHTLSDGTKAILGELAAPVVIRYYATRTSDFMPEEMKLHMRRVDELLKVYSSLSGGRLRVEHLDPEPDTEAEDAANLDGITGMRINDQNLYFGLAISCLDQTRVIPFLDPREETMLEYMLTSRIAEISAKSKPKVGLMSGLNIQGSPPMMPGQPPSQPWVTYQQLQQSYDLIEIPIDQPEIDPKEISVLLVFHPADIPPAAEFAIDQYLLQGGTVVACLDAFSIEADSQRGNPMMGGGAPTSSTLPNLLKAWGIEFESGMTLADPVYAFTFPRQGTHLAVLNLSQEAMPQKDDVITRDLDSVLFFLPGGFTKTDKCQLGFESLIRSSERAGFVDAQRAARFDVNPADVKPAGRPFHLMVRLHGKFPTAFPAGNPIPPVLPEAGSEEEGTAAANQPDKALKQATAEGNVFLIADCDAFGDRFAYQVQDNGGIRMATPVNGNSPLLFNLLDQATGSKHLIGSRSRAANQRPFTVIKEMEDKFKEEMGPRQQELEKKQEEIAREVNELMVQRSRGNQLFLSPEKEARLIKLDEERKKCAKEIRDLQKDLRRRKNDLTGTITLLNVAVMPAMVVIIGLALFLQRRRSTRAR